jgi:hypothetical protein
MRLGAGSEGWACRSPGRRQLSESRSPPNQMHANDLSSEIGVQPDVEHALSQLRSRSAPVRSRTVIL